MQHQGTRPGFGSTGDRASNDHQRALQTRQPSTSLQRSAFYRNTLRAAEAVAALRGQPRTAVRASSPEASRRQETCILPDDVQPGLHPLVLPAGSSHGSQGQGQRQGAHGVRRGATARVLPPGAEEGDPRDSGQGREACSPGPGEQR